MPSTCVDRSICCCSCQPLPTPTQNHSPLGATHLFCGAGNSRSHPPLSLQIVLRIPVRISIAAAASQQHRSASIAVPPTMSNGDLHSVPSTSAQCHPAVLYRREFSEPSTGILGAIHRLCFRPFSGISIAVPPTLSGAASWRYPPFEKGRALW